MAIKTEVVAINDATATLLSEGGGSLDDPRPVIIYGEGETGTYYVGGEGVDALSGIPVSVGAYQSFSLMYGDDLYAISDDGALNIRVMRGRVAL